MKKWTIKVEAVYVKDGKHLRTASLEVTDPEYYANFPDEFSARIFAQALSNDRLDAKRFVKENWGEDYAPGEDYLNSFTFEAAEVDWWPDDNEKRPISQVEDKVKSKLRNDFDRWLSKANKAFIDSVANHLNETKRVSSIYHFEQDIHKAGSELKDALAYHFEQKAVKLIADKLETLDFIKGPVGKNDGFEPEG